MTKKVRIENADTGTTFRVLVEVWDKGPDGQPDTLAKTVELNSPCSMTGDDIYITSSRYLVVKEPPVAG